MVWPRLTEDEQAVLIQALEVYLDDTREYGVKMAESKYEKQEALEALEQGSNLYKKLTGEDYEY